MTDNLEPTADYAVGCWDDCRRDLIELVRVRNVVTYEGDASVIGGVRTLIAPEITTAQLVVDAAEFWDEHPDGAIPTIITGRRCGFDIRLVLNLAKHNDEHPTWVTYDVEEA